MAGIYVHIPFCASRCAYCDFFSTTQLEKRKAYVQALIREMDLRSHYLPSNKIKTIYLGGGTPSQLTNKQIQQLLYAIRSHFIEDSETEITLEANPGDLTKERLIDLRSMGINRLSIGIQSFDDSKLRLIGRRHTAEEARDVVRAAKNVGFDNCSIDLIYGLPGQSLDQWKEEVHQALALNVDHISAYCLSYEEGTKLTKMRNNGSIFEVDEDVENEMYDYLVNTLKINGFEKYEVSNFARDNKYSQHNSSYWNDTPYLGLGAGAHSYDGQSRQWNVSSLSDYLLGIEKGEGYFEREELTDTDRYNEKIMLSLRTSAGLALNLLTEDEAAYVRSQLTPYINNGCVCVQDGRVVVSLQGTHILNRIIEDLMK